MKRILLACGSGIVTSTAARAKMEKILDENGYAGKYKVEQCRISEVASKSHLYDFCVGTSFKPAGVTCPYVKGTAFLTGIGVEETMKEIYKLMDSE